MSDINLQISATKVNYIHGEPLEIHYEATNNSSDDLFISRDSFTLVKESDTDLKVVIGVNPPGSDLDYQHFDAPQVDQLGAGQTIAVDISVNMPFNDANIDSNDEVNEFEVQVNGDIDLVVVLGYGTTNFKVKEHDPLYEFVAWQQFVTSNKVNIHIDVP